MLESNSGASGLQIFIRCLHHLSSWSSLRKQRTIFDCRCGFPTLVAAWRYYREQCLWWQRGFKVTLGRTRTDSRKLKPRMFFFFAKTRRKVFIKSVRKHPESNQIASDSNHSHGSDEIRSRFDEWKRHYPNHLHRTSLLLHQKRKIQEKHLEIFIHMTTLWSSVSQQFIVSTWKSAFLVVSCSSSQCQR